MVNHGETLKLVAKSISQVAVRLPRIKILSKLYPTRQMQLAVESLYSCILEFLLMAHAWCTESKFRHFYHSFTRPHELRYGDLLERITDCSNSMIELAAVGSQAEIHVMHETQTTKLDDLLSELRTLENSRTNQFDGLIHIVSRLEASGKKQGEKLDWIIRFLEGKGLTINELLAKLESKYSSRFGGHEVLS